MTIFGRRSHEHLLLAGLLIISLVLRLGWSLSRPITSSAMAGLPDQLEYLALGRNLLHAGMLYFFDPRFGRTVWAYRMPGYPAFIAACGGSLRVVRAAQAILDTSTVLAIYLLARRVMPATMRRGPMLAAGIVAINPFLIYFTGLILSETLFTAMIAWGMALLATPNESSRPRPMGTRAGLCGLLLLVLSVLVRPEGVLLASLLAVAALAVNNRRFFAYASRVRRPLIQAAAATGMLSLLLVAMVIFAWGCRNARVLGRPVWFTTNGGITLYDGNHIGADGSSNQAFLTDLPRLKSMSEIERNAYFTAAAKEFIAQHPGQWFTLALRKLARTWSPVPLSDAFGSRGHVAVALAYALPFDVLIVLGLISSRLPRSAKVFLLMPAIYLTAVHVSTVGSLRYRIPAEPPMAILAAVVLSRMRPDSESQAEFGEPGRPRPGQLRPDRGEDAPAL